LRTSARREENEVGPQKGNLDNLFVGDWKKGRVQESIKPQEKRKASALEAKTKKKVQKGREELSVGVFFDREKGGLRRLENMKGLQICMNCPTQKGSNRESSTRSFKESARRCVPHLSRTSLIGEGSAAGERQVLLGRRDLL